MIGAREDAGLERLCIDPGPSNRRKQGPMRVVKEASPKTEKGSVSWQGCRMSKCKNAEGFWLLQSVGSLIILYIGQ